MDNSKLLSSQFILYRFPEEEIFHLETIEISSEKDFSFHLQSFDKKKNLFFKGKDEKKILSKEFDSKEFHLEMKNLDTIDSNVFSKEEYLKRCETFIQSTRNEEFEKLVLSRIFKAPDVGDLIEKFNKLTQKYSNALIYLLRLENEIWIGATPEVLVNINGNKLQTMALAGTKNINRNENWSSKERHEHQVVVDYIAKGLDDFNPKIENTQTITLGNIQHLMTPISAQWEKENSVMKLISQLQPTPAICGIPKDKAFQYILENEGYDRSYYSGLIGWKKEDEIRYFVNLRCARVSASGMDIFVGGGITKGSLAEAEWEETRLKGEALINI